MKPYLLHYLEASIPSVIADIQVKDKFFKYLFEYNPKLAMIFAKDASTHHNQNEGVLNFILSNISNRRKSIIIQREWLNSDLSYVIKPEDFSYIKKALIYTVREILKDDFNFLIQEAWDISLNELAVILIESYKKKHQNRMIFDVCYHIHYQLLYLKTKLYLKKKAASVIYSYIQPSLIYK